MHSKFGINSFAAKTLIILILLTMVLSFTAVDATSEEDRVDFLLSLIQNANATVIETYSRLESQAISVPPSSLSSYNQALEFSDEAVKQIQTGNFSQAYNNALQALKQFKEALIIAYETAPDTPTQEQIMLERTVALRSAVDRTQLQILQLDNLSKFVAATGYNTTILENKIENAKALLANASSNLNQNNYETAFSNTKEAKTLVEILVTRINNFAATLKVQRLDAYMMQTEERLAALRTEATTAQNVASLSAINSADASLSDAKEYLEKEQLNETLNALAISKANEEKAIEYLKPTASATTTPPTSVSPSPTKSPSATTSLQPSPSSASATPTPIDTPEPTSSPSFSAIVP